MAVRKVLQYSAPPKPQPASRTAWWNRTATVAAGCSLVSLGVLLSYTGQFTDIVLYGLLIDTLFLVAWLASATGLGLTLLRPLRYDARGDASPFRGAVLHLVTAAGLGLGILGLLVLGLALAGWLSRAVAFVLLVPGLVAGAAALVRRRSPDAAPPSAADPAWRWLWLTAAPVAGLAVAAAMVPPGLLWKPQEPHGYDVVEYHLQVPREWYEAGRVVPLRHNAFSYMPLGVETHYLLAMHLRGGPYAGMYLAHLMHLVMVALSVGAVAGFARRWTGRTSPAAIAGVAAATVPWLAQVGSIAFNEGGFLLYGALAIGWAVDAAICPGSRRGLWRFVLGGAMAGFACGTKLTAVPEVLLGVPLVVGVVWVAVRVRHRREERENVQHPTSNAPRPGEGGAAPASDVGRAPSDVGRSTLDVGRSPLPFFPLACFPLVGLLVFSPWLVRNVAWAGNPVFPEGTAVFGPGHFSDVQTERWKRAHGPRPDQQSIPARAKAAWHEILSNWQFGYVLLPLSLAALVLARRNPAAWVLFGVLVVLVGFWLAMTHLQGRFFILAVPVCAMLLALVDLRGWHTAVAPIIVVAAAVALPRLHGPLAQHVRGSHSVYLSHALDDLGWMTDEFLEGFPKDDPAARLVLVGDAKAFWYALPMSRVRYRTVFDADTSGGDVLKAWAGGSEPGPNDWVLVDPAELERFARTYQPFPPLPAEWQARPEWQASRPFFLKRPVKQ